LAIAAWAVPCAYVLCYVCALHFLQVLSRVPRFFRGPSWLSPTISVPTPAYMCSEEDARVEFFDEFDGF
jgi:hypothetical protein